MTLQELQTSIAELSKEDLIVLLQQISQSLENDHSVAAEQLDEPARRAIFMEMRGFLKESGKPAPTDEEVAAMKEAYLVEKYLQ